MKYSSTTEDHLTIREKIQYSLLGVVVLGGAVLLGRNIVKQATADLEQRKTYSEGSPATFAKLIRMAFDNDGWWGTDKDALRQAVRDIPSKAEFRKVMTSYHKLYNSNLLAEMQSELKSTEYNELLAIISAKPEVAGKDGAGEVSSQRLEGWAKRLRSAFEISYGPFSGTDEPAIRAVFLEVPTQEAFSQLALAYRSLYGSNLADDLRSELEVWEYGPMMQIINSKPNS